MSYGQTVHAKTRIVLGQTRCRKCDWEVWCGFHHGTGENLHTRCRRHGLQLIWLTQKILDTGSWSRHGTIWVQGKTNCGYGKYTDAKLASLSTGNAVAVTRIRSQDCSIYLPKEYWDVLLGQFAVYSEVIGEDRLIQSKSQTYYLEQNNGRQMDWYARFRRKSIVVSKTLEMVNLTIALFARFHMNGSWKDTL